MAYIGKSPSTGVRNRFIYTATAGQTTFSGTDDHNRTLSYTDAEFTDVFLNGVKLDKSDYTATSGTSIVLDSGATVGDTLEILGFDTFSVFSGDFSQDVTIGGSATVSGDLTISDKIVHSGDANTAIRFASADTVTIETAGSERVRVDSNGQLGIGVTSVDTALHVKSANDTVAIIESSDATSKLQIKDSDSTNGASLAVTNETLNIQVNGSTRATIDSSGNAGIGSTSPHSELDVRGAGEIFTVQGDGGASAEMNLSLINGTGNKSTIINFGKNLGTSDRYLGRIIYEVDNNNMDFYTSGTFRARFTSAGNLAIGATTTSNKLEVRGVGLFSSDGNYRGSNSGILNVSPNGNLAIGFGGDTDANYYAAIFHNASNTAVGSIFVNASSTTYATSSDYRLKENVNVLTGAIERVKALAPKRFNFIAEPDRTMDGFLAHEAAAVVPEAVQGEKDAMSDQQFMVTPALGDIITPATDDADEVVHSTGVVKPDTLEDGQEWRQTASPIMETRSAPDYQGIDQAKLVPLLTAALQEAIGKIEALETRVAALEA